MFKPSSIPWNKDRVVGSRTAFELEEVQKIFQSLFSHKQYRDLAMFTVALDSMLRVSDLRQLRVNDIRHAGNSLASSFPLRQQKTSSPVYPVLTPTSHQSVDKWIEVSGKKQDDYLFTSFRQGWESRPLSESGIRGRVKQWAELIGLNSKTYSAHSLRRTKPIYLYRQGVRIELISLMLGHRDTKSTLHYLGIDQMEAQAVALKFDLFTDKARKSLSKKETIHRASKAEIKELMHRLKETDVLKPSAIVLGQEQLEHLADLIAIKIRNHNV